ncbi:hypothetical protein QJS66_09895 [Kocuria rhizophila]|nr:hypothetical protein QJS66_09895 [Kocuria rhizophila]
MAAHRLAAPARTRARTPDPAARYSGAHGLTGSRSPTPPPLHRRHPQDIDGAQRASATRTSRCATPALLARRLAPGAQPCDPADAAVESLSQGPRRPLRRGADHGHALRESHAQSREKPPAPDPQPALLRGAASVAQTDIRTTEGEALGAAAAPHGRWTCWRPRRLPRDRGQYAAPRARPIRRTTPPAPPPADQARGSGVVRRNAAARRNGDVPCGHGPYKMQ